MFRRSLIVSLTLLVSRTALAEPTPTELAEKLYEEGKRLAASGQLAEACPKFEESQRLEPAIGTQFNLADCYERSGRRATALALFREVARIAQMTGKQERQRAADERATSLDQSVARIRITFAPPTERKTSVDGVDAAPEAFAKGVPVDAGEHVIRSEAPGYLAWEHRLSVGAEPGLSVDVKAPPLERVAPLPAASSEPPRASPLRPIGLIVAGVGVVGLGIGAVFGLSAMSKKDDAGCNGSDCSAAAAGSGDKLRDAQAAGDVATIAFAAGAVVAATGLVLFAVAPSSKRSVSATTALATGGATLRIGGSF